jgi:hypothetical protein
LHPTVLHLVQDASSKSFFNEGDLQRSLRPECFRDSLHHGRFRSGFFRMQFVEGINAGHGAFVGERFGI